MARPKTDEQDIEIPELANTIFAGDVAAENLAKQGNTAPQSALAHARMLKKKGADATTIHRETSKMLEGTPYAGVHFGADGKPRFEISDRDARVKPLKTGDTTTMGRFMDHPELYRANPEAQFLEVEKMAGRGASYDGNKVALGDNMFSGKTVAQHHLPNASAKQASVHELQHHVQSAEGFAQGGSPDDFKKQLPGPKNESARVALYKSLAGEQEAEMARARTNMTPQERRASLPQPAVPFSEQIVTDTRGKVVEFNKAVDVDGKPATLKRIDPRKIKADPDTFQFKSGGDQAGVTDRLKTVRKWDPVSAGKAIVFERTGGEQVIADGHQRRGLALRAIEAGQKGVKMDAYVFREKDGWTASDVRAIAAMKNIREDSGSALDMAKVMRDRPDMVDGTIPMSSSKVKEARGLSKLSNEAFGMVAGGAVKPEIASAVGEQMNDTARHADMLKEMAKAKVSSAQHARLYVAQAVAAPSITETTGSLFGDETKVRSLLAERASVLNKAMDALRSDKRIFGMLEREAGTVEGAGNKLARTANADRADTAARMGELVEKLATMKGPVSEMLDRAARAVAEGGQKPAAAARSMVTEMRSAMKSGGVAALAGDGVNLGWGDAARAESAKVRGAKAKGRVQRMIDDGGAPPRDLSKYVDGREYEKAMRSNYFDGDQKIASSRQKPVSTEIPPVGSWRVDSFKGIHGREIAQLRRVPLSQLDLSVEVRGGQLDPAKRGDDARYAEWLKEGRRAPPIETVERADGKLRVIDGHRRSLAAKMAGRDYVEAWVSPIADHPEGLKESGGKVMKTGLTYEMATRGKIQQMVDDGWTRMSGDEPARKQIKTTQEAAAKWSRILDSIPTDPAEAKRVERRNGEALNKRMPGRVQMMADEPKQAPRGMDGLTRAERSGKKPGVSVDAGAAAPGASTMERFRAAYEATLTAQIKANPGKYAYGVERAPEMARKMTEALAKGAGDTQSPTVKAVTKSLGIKPTVGGIKAALNDQPAPAPRPQKSPLEKAEAAHVKAEADRTRAWKQMQSGVIQGPAYADISRKAEAAKKAVEALKGPAGWSDAAREASAEVRASQKTSDIKRLSDAVIEAGKAYREHGSGSPQDKAAQAKLDALDREIRAKHGMEPHWSQKPKAESKRVVTLGDGRKVGLGQYVNAWKQAKAMRPETGVRGTPNDPTGGGTAGEFVRQMREGMMDRINRHDPNFGKGRKWDDTWQRDARKLSETLSRKNEVPRGEAHPVDLRPRLAAMGKLEEGTFVPKPGGDRSKANQAARDPKYISGVGKPQESYWSAKAGPTPTVADLPAGAFKGSEKDFSSLSPGMRREIARSAAKMQEKTMASDIKPGDTYTARRQRYTVEKVENGKVHVNMGSGTKLAYDERQFRDQIMSGSPAPKRSDVQTSFLPEATTKEQIAAAAKAKGKPSAAQQDIGGLFGDSHKQTDLVEMAKTAKPDLRNTSETYRMMGVPADGSKPFVMNVMDMPGDKIAQAERSWKDSSHLYTQKLSGYQIVDKSGNVVSSGEAKPTFQTDLGTAKYNSDGIKTGLSPAEVKSLERAIRSGKGETVSKAHAALIARASNEQIRSLDDLAIKHRREGAITDRDLNRVESYRGELRQRAKVSSDAAFNAAHPGWSDAAREKSAEVRKGKAMTKKGDKLRVGQIVQDGQGFTAVTRGKEVIARFDNEKDAKAAYKAEKAKETGRKPGKIQRMVDDGPKRSGRRARVIDPMSSDPRYADDLPWGLTKKPGDGSKRSPESQARLDRIAANMPKATTHEDLRKPLLKDKDVKALIKEGVVTKADVKSARTIQDLNEIAKKGRAERPFNVPSGPMSVAQMKSHMKANNITAPSFGKSKAALADAIARHHAGVGILDTSRYSAPDAAAKGRLEKASAIESAIMGKKPSSGLRGTQNAANRDAIIKNRKANAKGPSADQAVDGLKKVGKATERLGGALGRMNDALDSMNKHLGEQITKAKDIRAKGGEVRITSKSDVEAKARAATASMSAAATNADREARINRLVNRLSVDGGDPVELRAKAEKLIDGAKKPAVAEPAAKPAKSSAVKKAVGLLAPIAIGTAMLAGANEAKAAGTSEAKGAAVEGVKATGAMAAFAAGTAVVAGGMIKAGMTAAKAIPLTQGLLMVGGAGVGAFQARNDGLGAMAKGAARGAWDMSLPGMVVNTAADAKHVIGERFNQANAKFEAGKKQSASERKPAGWSPEARIAAAQARGVALPYGGDPTAAPGWAPKKAKD